MRPPPVQDDETILDLAHQAASPTARCQSQWMRLCRLRYAEMTDASRPWGAWHG